MFRFAIGAIISLVIGSAVAASAQAQGPGTLLVYNLTNDYITVNVDGSYGCNTAENTVCSILLAPGVHTAVAEMAQRAMGPTLRTSTTFALASGEEKRWCVLLGGPGSDPSAPDRCRRWAAGDNP